MVIQEIAGMMAVSYTHLIVHIDVDTASISRNGVVDVPIVADANVALDK